MLNQASKIVAPSDLIITSHCPSTKASFTTKVFDDLIILILLHHFRCCGEGCSESRRRSLRCIRSIEASEGSSCCTGQRSSKRLKSSIRTNVGGRRMFLISPCCRKLSNRVFGVAIANIFVISSIAIIAVLSALCAAVYISAGRHVCLFRCINLFVLQSADRVSAERERRKREDEELKKAQAAIEV